MIRKHPTAILNDAADIIDRDGWVQGELSIPGQGRCTLDAIAASGDGFGDPAVYLAVAALNGYLGSIRLAAWNDAPGRTHAEVVSALRGAAREARDAARA